MAVGEVIVACHTWHRVLVDENSRWPDLPPHIQRRWSRIFEGTGNRMSLQMTEGRWDTQGSLIGYLWPSHHGEAPPQLSMHAELESSARLKMVDSEADTSAMVPQGRWTSTSLPHLTFT